MLKGSNESPWPVDLEVEANFSTSGHCPWSVRGRKLKLVLYLRIAYHSKANSTLIMKIIIIDRPVATVRGQNVVKSQKLPYTLMLHIIRKQI